jgi:hypothetical protein
MATSTSSGRRPSPTSSGTTSEPRQPLQRAGASPDRPRHAGPPAGPRSADGGPLPPPRRAMAAVRVARAGHGLGGVAGRNAGSDRSGRRAPTVMADRGGSARRDRPAAPRTCQGARRQPAPADRPASACARPGCPSPQDGRGRADRAVRRTAGRVEPRRLPFGVRSPSGRRLPRDASKAADVSAAQGARRRSISSR